MTTNQTPDSSQQNTQSPRPLLSASDERTSAMLAHLSIVLNIFTGFLGPVAAITIYLIFKDRSFYVRYQSLQAFVFQMIAWVFGIALAIAAWVLSGILTTILVGCLCMPIAAILSLIPVGALFYGVVAGIQCGQGEEFKYWLVSDLVEKIFNNV
jgi:uncharacterized Tic20 family protein